MINKKTQGKKNREAGARFELRVRKDLEKKGWIVDRWGKNVRFGGDSGWEGKLSPAKSRFNMRTTGFPDFIIYSLCKHEKINAFDINGNKFNTNAFIIFGVECKSNGYLDKQEKEKCKWLLANNIFSKIFIASKGEKRGEIIYKEFE